MPDASPMPDREDFDEHEIEALGNTSVSDRLGDLGTAVAEGAIAFVPVVGPLLAPVVAHVAKGYFGKKKDERLVAAIQEIGVSINGIEGRLDREFIKTEEFEALVEQVLDDASEAKAREKRRFYAAVVANSAVPERPDEDERTRMLRVLETLTMSQLRLLAVIDNTTKPRPDLYMGGVMDTLSYRMPGLNQERAIQDWADLARLDVVSEYPAAMMTAEGAGNLKVRIRPFGRRFIEFINLTEGDARTE